MSRLRSKASTLNSWRISSRSPTHKPKPYPDGGEFDEGEVVGVVLFVARRPGPEMFEFVEEALDEISKAIEVAAEGGDVHPARHWFDVAPCALSCEARPQGVAVVAAVGQENLTLAETFEHVGGASSGMSLPRRQLQENGQAVGVDQGMDFRRQSASRTPIQPPPVTSPAEVGEASSDPLFCRSHRAGGRGSKNCRSSADRRRRPLKRPRISDPRRQSSPSGRNGCSRSSKVHSVQECRPRANRSAAASKSH